MNDVHTHDECQSIDRAFAQIKARLAETERSAAVGYFFWDISANVFEWSDGLCKLYGIAPSDFGRTYEAFLGFVHPADVGDVREAVAVARRAGKAFDFHHRILRPDGHELTLHTKGSVVLDAAGNVQSISGTEQDVTAIRQLIADMRRYAQELEKMNKLMVGRELKMIELKKAVDAMTGKDHV